VGPVPKGRHLDRLLEGHGVLAHTVVTGHVPFGELAAHVELADVVAHLRYPTARETSAALLRVLAQGRPTVMTDLEQLSDIPADAVLRADPTDEEGAVTRALLRLADSPALRVSLGERAAAYVAREHTALRCAETYEAALSLAARAPDPPVRATWPAAWKELRG
jgi:glycosyltransferase involved in cell wall biosynthesis